MKSERIKFRKGDRVKLKYADEHDIALGFYPGLKGFVQEYSDIPYVSFDDGRVECFNKRQLVRLVPKRGVK